MILILSNPDDPHAITVAAKLRARGASLHWVDHTQFPRTARVSLRLGGEQRVLWRLPDRDLDLSGLTAIWHRRPYMPIPADAITEARLVKTIVDDGDLFLRDLWSATGCLTVPAPSAVYRRADFKACQLTAAVRLGLEIPDTLFTNDPGEALDFYRRHDGFVISKLVSPVINRDHLDDVAIRYTELVTHRDVGYFQAVKYGPVAFQAYVPKKLELRITIVGDRIFPVEIHSQATRRTKHDWRKYDHFNTPLRAHDLPDRIASKLLALMRGFELRFGAIDMILTPDGRYVFLEINPNGQFLWIEQITGVPISDALCDLLLAAQARGDSQ